MPRVLAVLLKETMPEYSGIPLEAISKDFIFDYRQLFSPSAPDEDQNNCALTASTEILGPTSAIANMDVLLFARMPRKSPDALGQVLNIEFQNFRPSRYDIIKIGIYYTSCIIKWQYGNTFSKSQYNRLLKTTSIWICPWLTADGMDSACRYHTTESPIAGEFHAAEPAYDMTQVIVVRFNPDGTPHPSRLIAFLQTLFTSNLSGAEKRRILAEQYSITIEEKEMNDMIDFSELYMQLGMRKGISKGIAQGYAKGEADERKRNFADLASLGNSECTVKMAVRHILAGRLTFNDIASYLTADETVKVMQQTQLSPLHA